MARSPFPRSRGGRGPQVGPGTFLGRSAPTDDRPQVFSHIAWSPGITTPDIEMWCFRKKPGDDYDESTPFDPAWYFMINPTVESYHVAWLDQVPAEQEFQPAPNDPQPTLSFRQYAVGQMLLRHQVQTGPGDWAVRIARPYHFVDAPDKARRFGGGIFEVRQSDRSNLPVSWVWVTPNWAREIWLHWNPGEPDGFAFVGRPLPPLGQPYVATQLKYIRVLDETYEDIDVLDYGNAITTLKREIRELDGSPVTSDEELEVHDFRIGGDL